MTRPHGTNQVPHFAAHDGGATVELARACVLIAEDNPVNLAVASFHLEDLGCSFETAVDGSLALSIFEHSEFDYVLMDCQMPVMDGFQALAAMRAFEVATERKHSKIIAVTADDDQHMRLQCAAAGFDGFLAKPFAASQLAAVLLDCRASLCNGVNQRVTRLPIADNTAASTNGDPPVIDRLVFDAFVVEFDHDTVKTLLASFVQSLRESCRNLERARTAQDTPALAAMVHKIAGAAGTVGAISVLDAAHSLEASCKSGQFQWTDSTTRFGDALTAAIAAFEPLISLGATERSPSFKL